MPEDLSRWASKNLNTRMHNKLIVLNDQYHLCDNAFFKELNPDCLCFREEFSMFLNSLGATLRRKGEIETAKSTYQLSLEIFENKYSLMALVLLLFENHSRDEAKKYAVRYVALNEIPAGETHYLENPKNKKPQNDTAHGSFYNHNSATMDFMKAITKDK